MIGSVRDAVASTTMHSGADEVEIHAAPCDDLLTVKDARMQWGFLPGKLTERGISASIVRRAADQWY